MSSSCTTSMKTKNICRYCWVRRAGGQRGAVPGGALQDRPWRSLLLDQVQGWPAGTCRATGLRMGPCGEQTRGRGLSRGGSTSGPFSRPQRASGPCRSAGGSHGPHAKPLGAPVCSLTWVGTPGRPTALSPPRPLTQPAVGMLSVADLLSPLRPLRLADVSPRGQPPMSPAVWPPRASLGMWVAAHRVPSGESALPLPRVWP